MLSNVWRKTAGIGVREHRGYYVRVHYYNALMSGRLLHVCAEKRKLSAFAVIFIAEST